MKKQLALLTEKNINSTKSNTKQLKKDKVMAARRNLLLSINKPNLQTKKY